MSQGTTGKCLFIIYINDLGLTLGKCKIHHLFPDDTLIYFYRKDFRTVAQTLNWELNILTVNLKWINCQKNEKIDSVDDMKYSGLILDKGLIFTKHVDYMSKKIEEKFVVMRRLSCSLSLFPKKTIFNKLSFPLLFFHHLRLLLEC